MIFGGAVDVFRRGDHAIFLTFTTVTVRWDPHIFILCLHETLKRAIVSHLILFGMQGLRKYNASHRQHFLNFYITQQKLDHFGSSPIQAYYHWLCFERGNCPDFSCFFLCVKLIGLIFSVCFSKISGFSTWDYGYRDYIDLPTSETIIFLFLVITSLPYQFSFVKTPRKFPSKFTRKSFM